MQELGVALLKTGANTGAVEKVVGSNGAGFVCLRGRAVLNPEPHLVARPNNDFNFLTCETKGDKDQSNDNC